MFSPVYASAQEQYISLLTQVIALLEQQVQVLMAQLSQIQTNSTLVSVSTTTPSFGDIQPIIQPLINQITMPTQPTLECNLTAESNVGAPSSYVKLTWTSNADSAKLSNSHISTDLFNVDLNPVTGGTQAFQLSSEKGENNIFTARFILKEQTQDCTVSVLTQ